MTAWGVHVARLVVAVAAAPARLPAPAGAHPTPQSPPKGQVAEFLGGPATPQPISIPDAPPPPRHPFMAVNDRSNIHDDAYQTDTVDGQGPLGNDMVTLSQAELGDCGSLTFDRQGRVET